MAPQVTKPVAPPDLDEDRATVKLRPGFLVTINTRVEGGVTYQREDLDASSAEVATETGKVERWNTTKVTDDPAEHERATAVVSKARGLVTALCYKTVFGHLCPEDKRGALVEAKREARRLVREFNAGAKYTRAYVYFLDGQIASTDEESVRAISDQVSQLVDRMNAGIDKLDVEAIRKAADAAKQLQGMLGAEQAEVVQGAIEQARKAARAIVKRVQTDGEAAEIVLKDVQRGSLEKARIAFLDLECAGELPAAVAPVANVNAQRVAGLDLGDAGEG